MMPGMSRPQCRMMAEQILRDSAPLDCQLGNILSRGQLGEDGERRVKQLRCVFRVCQVEWLFKHLSCNYRIILLKVIQF